MRDAAPEAIKDLPSRSNLRVVQVYSDKPVYLMDGYAILPDPTTPESSDAGFILHLDTRAFCEGGAVAAGVNPRCISTHRDHPQNRRSIGLLLAARTVIVQRDTSTGGLSLVTMTENLISRTVGSRAPMVDLSARQDKAPTLGIKPSEGDPQVYAVYPGAQNPELVGLYDQLKADQAPAWKLDYPDLQWQLDRARDMREDYDWVGRDPCKVAENGEECKRQREPRGLAGLPGGSWLALSYRVSALRALSLGQPGGDGGRGIAAKDPITCGFTLYGSSAYACSIEPACALEPPTPGKICPGTGPGQDPVPGATGNVCMCQVEACSYGGPTCAAVYSGVTNVASADPTPPEVTSTTCPNIACQMTVHSVGAQGGQAGIGGLPGHLFVHTVTSASSCEGNYFTSNTLADPNKADKLDKECLAEPGAECSKSMCQSNKNVQVCSDKPLPDWDAWSKDIENFLDLWEVLIPGNLSNIDLSSFSADMIDASTTATKLVRFRDGYLLLEPGKEKPGKKKPSVTVPKVTYLMVPPWAPRSFELPRIFWDPSGAGSPSSVEDVASQALDAEEGVVDLELARKPRCRCEGEECRQKCRKLSSPFVERYKEMIARTDFSRAVQQLRTTAIARGTSPDVPVSASVTMPFSGDFKGGFKAPLVVLTIEDLALAVDLSNWKGPDAGDLKVVCNDDATVSFLGSSGLPGQPGLPGMGASAKQCPSWLPEHEVCYRPISPSCPKGPIVLESQIGGSCFADCAKDTLYQDFYDPSASCPAGYQQGSVSKVAQSYVGSDGRSLLCPGYANQPNRGAMCLSPAGKMGSSVIKNPKDASDPVPDFTAVVTGQVREWSRADWATANAGLHELEMRRRMGQGNTHFKRDELLDAKTRYLSTRAHLNQAETKSNVGCTLDKLDACSVCKDGPDKAPNAWKSACALGTEIDQRAGRLFRDENYYGYERNYVPPMALRTFSDGTAVSLADVVRDELNLAKTDAGQWLEFGGLLGSKYADNQVAQTQLTLQRAELAQTYAPGGSLSVEMSAKDAQILDLVTLIKDQQEQIKQLGIAKKNILLKGKPDFQMKLLEVVKVAAMAAASSAGGVAGVLVATAVWEAASSSETAKEIAEEFINDSKDENAKKWLADQKMEQKCVSCQTWTSLESSDDSRVDWSAIPKGVFTTENAKKAYDIFTKEGNSVEDNIKIAVIDSTAQLLGAQAAQLGLQLATVARERRVLQQKATEARLQVARIDVASQAITQAFSSSAINQHPAFAVQSQIVEAALNRAAARVERSGEHFFLLRRGVERETVPGDPLTGKSKLTAYEDQTLLSLQECFDADVKSSSLNITFKSLPCFEARTEKLRQYAQLYWGTGGKEKEYFLDMLDTVVPRVKPANSTSPHTWTTDAQGNHTIELNLNLAIAHRDIRSEHRAQKLENISFFVETNDPSPAVLPLRVQRDSLDTYWIGTRPDLETGAIEDVFQLFDVAKGTGSSQLGLLDLARVPDNYVHDAAVCNGLTEASPLQGPFQACSLKQENIPAFLARQSLLGRVTVSLSSSALAGRVPKALRAFVTYRYVK